MAPTSYPSGYIIAGRALAEPLVTVSSLQVHVRFLHAVKQLRTTVEEGTDERLPEMARMLESAERWTWFLHLAVDRFQAWLNGEQAEGLSFAAWMTQELPPLDVLMVWHAYTLNPFWYSEDCLRFKKLLRPLRQHDYLLEAIMNVDDYTSHAPTQACVETWDTRCNSPYDPLDAAAAMKEHTVVCAKCLYSSPAPYLALDGTGYAQAKFALICMNCSFQITKETLAVLKFAQDMSLDPNNPQDQLMHGKGVFLPGTLNNARVRGAVESARVTKANISRLPHLVMPDPGYSEVSKQGWVKTLCQRLQYSMRKLVRATAMFEAAPRILRAYTDDRPFSVDLVGAITRHSLFVDKIHELGWTAPGFFDLPENETVLVHAVARYHAFLDLLAADSDALCVPTLDIDLAWHTHQMRNVAYSMNCMKFVGRFIDHDDAVEDNILSTAFDTTCQEWEKRFHLPYSYCGCPLPGTSIGQRLSRFQDKLGLREATMSRAVLVPPQREDALRGTHASDHNCVKSNKKRIAYSILKSRAEEVTAA